MKTEDKKSTAVMESDISGYWEDVCQLSRDNNAKGLARLTKKVQVFTALPLEKRLFIAAGAGNGALVRELADAGASLNWQAEDVSNRNALASAASRGDIKMISTLVKLGADVNVRRPDGGTALMDASINGHLDAVRLLIKQGADVNICGDNNRTAVLLAASGGHDDVVTALVEAGADLNLVLDNGLCCIGAALGFEHFDLAGKILVLGANPNAKNNSGYSSLPGLAIQKAGVVFLRALAAAGLKFDDPQIRNEILEAAAVRAEPKVVEFLRNVGVDAPDVDFNQQDENGYTPLIAAVLARNLERARMLLEAGADTSLCDVDRETALSLAIDFNLHDFVELLREYKAQTRDYSSLDPVGAMLKAATDGALGSILDLKDDGVSLSVVDADGNTPLILATQNGHHGVVRALCQMGALINSKNKARQSAYAIAVSLDDQDVMRTLKEHSARDARDDSGSINHSILDFITGRASRPGKDQSPADDTSGLMAMFERTLKSALNEESEAESSDNRDEPKAPPAIINAIFEGDIEKIKELIDSGIDLGAASIQGMNPLHFSIAVGNVEIVNLILESGANIDLGIENETGMPPLVVALNRGKTDIFEMLLERGAKVNTSFCIRDTESQALLGGLTPLWTAASLGNSRACTLLLDRGAAIDSPSGNGHTPLTMAIQSDDDKTIQLLLKRGANPDPSIELHGGFKQSFTPMTLAAARGNIKAVKSLLARGASTESRDSEGWTALKRAVRTGNDDLVRMLVKSHADVEVEDHEGWRSIHNACAENYHDVVSTLLSAGADPNAPVRGGRYGDIGLTPLILAAMNGASSVVDLLIDQGADVNVLSLAGNTALCVALNAGYGVIARRLLEAGADPRIGKVEDLPPLLLACLYADKTGDTKDLKLVEYMLKRGADQNQEVDGQSIFEAVKMLKNRKLERLLSSHAAGTA